MDHPGGPFRESTNAVDAVFTDVDSKWRGLLAIGTTAALAFSVGIAVSTFGLRTKVDKMDEKIDTNIASISSNHTQIVDLQTTIDKIDLTNMAERIRRMDREFCLFQADMAGTLTAQKQAECSNR
jgi:hypothetical protein